MTKKKTPAKASKAARVQAQAQVDARSNAAEEQRMKAKQDRIQSYLAESRKREAELTEQGYFF